MSMNFEQILEFLLSIQIRNVVKLIASLTILLYIVFAWIVVRQVNLMAKTLMVPIDLPIKIVAWLHLGLSIFVFLISLVIL